METIYWGPSGWRFLHLLTFLYPETPDTGDKILMRDMMILLPDILPCKYCRASFTKYMANLDITPALETRDLLVEWLYKMHNKVNKKLRSQGFCHHDNPTLDHVSKLYTPKVAKVHHLLESGNDGTLRAQQWICNEGLEFLGSIIFNYQGYFANCHTSEEKSKIGVSYHKFFNTIPLLIRRLLHPNRDYKLDPIKKFRIRNMLQQNEPYSRLKRWFYECGSLCIMQEKYKTYEEYESEFNRHIVSSCNNPKADNIKSCRKVPHSRTRGITKKAGNLET
jgi:Erv1 / Alr family